MKKIYAHKSKLRIQLETKSDLSGYQQVWIAAIKTDGTRVDFPAVVKDVEAGLIFYDVQTENDIDQIGWWTFWADVIFDDDRTACGEPVRRFVYEAGR